MSRRPAHAAKKPHVGIIDDGGSVARQFSDWLRTRKYPTTCLTLESSLESSLDAATWDDAAIPLGIEVVVPVGGRRASAAAARSTDDRVLRTTVGGDVGGDVGDELGLLLRLADADLEVPRILGSAVDPSDLIAALPTDGPVVLKHSHGSAVADPRVCRDREALVATTQLALNDDRAGTWYLEEYLPGGDALVTGIFDRGVPSIWGSFGVTRGRRGHIVTLDPIDVPRLLEVSGECAALLGITGAAQFAFRVRGPEVFVVGVTPCVTAALLHLRWAARSHFDLELAQMVARATGPAVPGILPVAPPPRPVPIVPDRALDARAGRPVRARTLLLLDCLRTGRLWSWHYRVGELVRAGRVKVA